MVSQRFAFCCGENPYTSGNQTCRKEAVHVSSKGEHTEDEHTDGKGWDFPYIGRKKT